MTRDDNPCNTTRREDGEAHDVETLAGIDKFITDIDRDGIRARWDFGRRMLLARDGKGRLPNNYLVELIERTGRSRSELKYRAQFAAKYPTEDELANVLASFANLLPPIITWHDLIACRFTMPRDKPPADESSDAATNSELMPNDVADDVAARSVFNDWLKTVKTRRTGMYGLDKVDRYSAETRHAMIRGLLSLVLRLEGIGPRERGIYRFTVGAKGIEFGSES